MTREITIRPMLNGFLCVVGCQCVVFTDKQSMLTALSEYYDDPHGVEKRFIARAINKTMDGPVAVPTMANDCGRQVGQPATAMEGAR